MYGWTIVKQKFKTHPQINNGSTACQSSGQPEARTNSKSESSPAVWKLSELHADNLLVDASVLLHPFNSDASRILLGKPGASSEIEFSVTLSVSLSRGRSLAIEGGHVIQASCACGKTTFSWPLQDWGTLDGDLSDKLSNCISWQMDMFCSSSCRCCSAARWSISSLRRRRRYTSNWRRPSAVSMSTMASRNSQYSHQGTFILREISLENDSNQQTWAANKTLSIQWGVYHTQWHIWGGGIRRWPPSRCKPNFFTQNRTIYKHSSWTSGARFSVAGTLTLKQCSKVHQNMPFSFRKLKHFLRRTHSPSSDSTPCGRGSPPTHPRRQSSHLQCSTFAPRPFPKY